MDDMQEMYFKQMRWWFDEFMASCQVEHYVELFPELNSRLSKYAIGIFLWNMKGLIDIDNPDDVNRVRGMLKVIDSTPAFDFFANTFNELDPDTVSQIIGLSTITPVEEGEIEFDYCVWEVKSFEEAHDYFEIVSWCIVISEESFKAYTANGNRFYMCGNGDWWEIPCVPGKGFPYDKYGYSMLAVEVTPDNKIASVTSRWNTYGGKEGDFLSPEELRRVLGEKNFRKLFVQSSKNDSNDTE